MSMPDPYVYISYSHRDKLVVDQFIAALRARNLRVWQDINEIEPGENWQRAIENGIKAASALLYFITPNSNTSQWVQWEIKSFIERGKPIVPVVVDEVETGDIPEILRSIQWVNLDVGIDKAADSIVKLLSDSVSLKKFTEVPRQKSKGYAFINYAEEDYDFFGELRGFLKHRGYAYWDYEESKRNYHGQLFIELEDVILNSAAVLSVLSEDWKRSKWTVREYFFSEEVGTPIFLLKAKPMGPTLAIAGTPYIDFVKEPRRGFCKLGSALDRKEL